MRSSRFVLPAALLLLSVLTACSDRTSTTFTTRPQTGRYGLTGRVRITSDLYDLGGHLQGTRVVDDASGVRVRLQRPDGSTDSVHTQDGAFEFRVNDSGHYRVSCWVVAPDTVATSDVTIDAADAAFPDTLRFLPTGGMNNAPNPYASDGTGIEFILATPQSVQASVLNVAGVPVWSYTSAVLPAGFEHIHWAALLDDGDPAPPGSYWAVLRRDGGVYYNLVFNE